MIVCAAVIGPANNPLHLQTFVSDVDPLRFHFIVHCALDVVDERLSNRSKGSSGGDSFLGLLYLSEDYRIYGYVTNTRAKLVLVDDDPEPKEADIKESFRRMHAAYVNAVSNPFHRSGQVINSKSFTKALLQIAEGTR